MSRKEFKKKKDKSKLNKRKRNNRNNSRLNLFINQHKQIKEIILNKEDKKIKNMIMREIKDKLVIEELNKVEINNVGNGNIKDKDKLIKDIDYLIIKIV